MMRNIYSRNKFKKINEDSSTVKDVANVSNSPAEIKEAWNTSLVGAITNGIVGGTIKALDSIYKWGRRGWYRRNLLSKLNKEFLKALIFFADKSNIDLATGKIVGGESNKAQAQAGQAQSDDVDNMSQQEFELGELAKKVAGFKTLEEMQLDEDVKDYYDLFKQKEKKLKKVNNYFNSYEDALERAKKSKDESNVKYYEDLLEKTRKAKEDLEITKKENDKAKKILDKKLIELGGTPEDLTKEKIDSLKKDIFKDGIEKILPDGWEPTSEFKLDNIPNFIDYPTFKNLRDNSIPDPSKVKVGDKFTYYISSGSNKGKKTNVAVRDVKEKIKKGNIPVTINNASSIISKYQALPDDFPSFSKMISHLEKMIYPNIKKYDKLSGQNKQKFLEIVQTYKVLEKMYDVLKPSMGITVDKPEEELTIDSLNVQNDEQLYELQVSKKSGHALKASGGLEGGDLKKGADSLVISDVLSNKEIQKIKSSGVTNLDMPVLSINYGVLSNTIEEKSAKKEVSNLVNKYNLEVIKLVADKVFETDKQKKKWSERVNKVNAFWDDLLEVDDVDILKGLSFGNVKDSSRDKNINEMSGVFGLSALKESLLDEGRLIISEVNNGVKLILLFNYMNNSYIMTGKGSGVKLEGKIVIRLATILEYKEKDGKEVPLSNDKKLQDLFVKNVGNINVNGQNKTSFIDTNEISTYMVFKSEQGGPKNVTNKPITASVIIINHMIIKESGNSKPIICVFDEKNKNNINLLDADIESIPELKITLQYVAPVKGDADPKILEETKLDTINTDVLANSSQKIQQQIKQIQQKKTTK